MAREGGDATAARLPSGEGTGRRPPVKAPDRPPHEGTGPVDLPLPKRRDYWFSVKCRVSFRNGISSHGLGWAIIASRTIASPSTP